MQSSPIPLWLLVLYAGLVALLVAAMVGISALLGSRHKEAAAGEIYEAGIASTGSAHVRFAAKFYLMAMFFVIFDLEAVFVYAYAVAFRNLGWMGFGEIAVFIAILLVALAYLWRSGALDWGPALHTDAAGAVRGRAETGVP